MRKTAVLLGALISSLFSAKAFALEQPKHRDISQRACLSAGLPSAFCKRVGAEAYNVDSAEWTNLSAHAQPDNGQPLCSGANAAASRVSSLGGEIRSALGMPASQDRANTLAVALGRVLHTLQDNCAHKGVSNPQHAWWSLMDTCEGTRHSPDVQSDAVACANAETEAVISGFAQALYGTGVTTGELAQTEGVSTHWPARGEVCEFLAGAKDWGGQDVRWNSGGVVQALRDQFLGAMSGNAVQFDFCSLPESAMAAPNPEHSVDTSAGPQWCLKLNVFCVGKGDAPDEAPPWADAEAEQDSEQASDSTSESAQGCATPARAPGRGSAPWYALVAGVAIAVRRRRRA